MLSLAGARLPPDLCPPAGDNPTGFWEPKRAIELNDAFVTSQGSSLYDPSLILQMTPPSEGDRRNFVLRIRTFFESFDIGALTVLKDPRISVLLPFWLEAAKEAGHSAVAVQIFRSPNQVARSLAVRQNMAPAHALALWSSHNLLAERDARSLPRLFVSYDDLLRDWRSVVSRCADELGLRLIANAKVEANVGAFLNENLRHHHASNVESTGCPFAEATAERVFILLKDAALRHIDQAAFDSELTSLFENAPILAEEATRDSWLLDVSLRDALGRAEADVAEFERRTLTLDGVLRAAATEAH
ncbi:MAG TPA: hypothetical protein VK760_00030 [Candidatus Acidoferrales bacterium]|nr:hypothetical protein [Candidatus Acidoferrales bacterium]